MSHRTANLTDEAITQLLRARSGDPELVLLDEIVRTVGATRQDRPWLPVPQVLLPRRTPLLVALALLLAAVGALGVGSRLLRPDLTDTLLPATPDAWERVRIETPQGAGSVASIAASPQGLLAVVQGGDRPEGGDGPTRLAVSTDGRSWTLVPEERHPLLSDTNGFGLPTVVGTDRGFLLLQLNEVWISETGDGWRRLASESTDPDLRPGGPRAAIAGGPGLVAVGGDKAWYSVDGSDWSLAEVPPPPTEFFARGGYPAPTVEMRGIATAGDRLFAWGRATAVGAGQEVMADPAISVLWASSDGLTWTSALDPEELGPLQAVAAGPAGLVAIEASGDVAAGHPQFVARYSADGDSWERVDVFDPRAPWPDDALPYGDGGDIVEGMPLSLAVTSVAATSAGYVAVGSDGECHTFRTDRTQWCLSEEAAVWTSVDGRSWSRLQRDDLFILGEPRGPVETRADTVLAWGSRFVVGGVHDGKPAIWISR